MSTSHREDAAAPGAYNLARIAWELERTAMGDGHYGNALRASKDIPGVTVDERSLLDRYASGLSRGTDHVALQALALRLGGQAVADQQPEDLGSKERQS